MADTLTANYGWTKPDPGGDANTWGTTLNSTTDKIDAQVFTNANAGCPIGTVLMWSGATAPANWLLCDGSSYATSGAYAALFAITGYAFGGSGANFNVPNLTQRFPLGAGVGAGTNPVGKTGGNFSNVLQVANLPAHTHTITDPKHTHTQTQTAHAHTISDPGHAHGASQAAHTHTVGGTSGPAGSGFAAGAGSQVVTATTSSAQPAVTVNTGPTNITATAAANANLSAISVAATGITATNSAGSGAAFLVAPPWCALNFIIRYA